MTVVTVPAAIHLLGRPSYEAGGEAVYRLRSRKSWALLAYLLLREHPPTRAQLAALLFPEADDPLRALRWSLSEIRRGFAGAVSVEGDPVVLHLPAGTVVDVEVVTKGDWTDAVALPGLGAELLDGMAIRDAPGFESWLVSEQRHLAAATEAILHEAASASLAHGELGAATDYAVRLVGLNPLDENHQTLLIRTYRLAGDDVAAQRQHAACVDLFERELGTAPGAGLDAALRVNPTRRDVVVDEAAIRAGLEAGIAAVGAGAVESGVESLRTVVGVADGSDGGRLRMTSRLALAEAVIHSLRGHDEEGTAILHEVIDLAAATGEPGLAAEARAELGYVDYLRARYDRADRWLDEALAGADVAPTLQARAKAFLGSVASDRADYAGALRHLDESTRIARAEGEPRREAYVLSMVGRVHLLRGELDEAAEHLDTSIALATQERWLAFLPWPQALRGEVDVERGDPAQGGPTITEAFARACQLGDPCWEGTSARAMALVAEANGDTEAAFDHLADARTRCNRLADPYVWLDVNILDVQCALGRRHGHPDTSAWVDRMHDVASRTGMRELVVRSLVHRAALGGVGDHEAARLLASDIDNPALDEVVAAGGLSAGP